MWCDGRKDRSFKPHFYCHCIAASTAAAWSNWCVHLQSERWCLPAWMETVSGLKPASAMRTVNQLTHSGWDWIILVCEGCVCVCVCVCELLIIPFIPDSSDLAFLCNVTNGKEAVSMHVMWYSIVCREWDGDDSVHKQWHQMICWLKCLVDIYPL